MSAIQPYLANALFNHVLRGIAYTSPSNVYAALFVGGIEVSGGGYARQPVHGSTAWSSPINGAGTNSDQLPFGPASSPWGTVDSVGLFDASTGGNLLIYGPLLTTKIVGLNDTFDFAIGALAAAFQ